MNAVDTNVLMYVHDPRDPRKQTVAANLVATLGETALLWQVMCEFLAASRKLEAYGFTFEYACDELRILRRVWASVLPTETSLERVPTLRSRYSLSFWDSLLVSGCLTGGITRLYTEDFGGHRDIDGLEIVNPFL